MKVTKILIVLLALSSGVFAQDNEAKLKLARGVISAMQADKMFEGMAAHMKQMAVQASASSNATPEEKKKNEELQGKIMDLSMDLAKGMIAKMDQIYVDVYSEAELKAMYAFFTSPEGKSMITKQPAVMAQMMPLVQVMQQELEPKIKALVEESASAK